MSKAWGIYVRYGRITMTKRIGCLLKTMKRYNRLTRRKAKSDIWIALVPISNE
ncbi:Hypothetical protein LUCI_1112 [Lucifera butyrica]|uniref:Uncharacterized protein n=1 Tax=Lucifera butyrica TaxID=1351585 RepID=A0A498R3C4_9FIRM|nr:hypothetical protein [Lucifera butyrica]VBB05901.1 Hypothetical protein LUCI_1112 [Lucifera butyrica]